MDYDDMIHCIVHGFSRGIIWHDFSDVGLNEPFYEWHYAQDRLYVIRDKKLHNYRFIKAGNPAEAMKVIQSEYEEVKNETGNWR